MSHLDEGTLHALLDDELGSTELMEIEAHLDGCAACSARLRDAREFLEEADRLVGTVQFRGRETAAVNAAPAPPKPEASTRPVTPPPPRSRDSGAWQDASPVLLIPDNPESAPGFRRWPRVLGWAATITVAVGGGFLTSHLSKEAPEPSPARQEPSAPVVSSAEAPARNSGDSQVAPRVIAQNKAESTSLADERVLANPSAAAKAAAAKAAAPKPAPAAPSTPAKQPPPARELAAKAAPSTDAAPGKEPALTKDAAPTKDAPPAKKTATGRTDNEDKLDRAEEAATKAAEQEAIRVQAAQALNQLDRERRVSRAAAATAALDQAAATRSTQAPAAAPPPPTLEQRSQVYLRIGLDEASRQLGGPVHVIEGMNPVFMGLAPGRSAAGADTTRPIVRVVYQDSQGRLILLDQQRSRAGQPATPAGGSWKLGDLTMSLHGDAPAEALKTLRSRVR